MTLVHTGSGRQNKMAPRIFVHLNAEGVANGLYRVEYLSAPVADARFHPPRIFSCVSRSGRRYNLPLLELQYFSREQCTFFRGVVAELLNVLFLGRKLPWCGAHVRSEVQLRRTQEVEAAVPYRLWAG